MSRYSESAKVNISNMNFADLVAFYVGKRECAEQQSKCLAVMPASLQAATAILQTVNTVMRLIQF